MRCPGSVKLSLDAPKPKPTPYSIEGTKAHSCLEFLLLRYKDLRHAVLDAEKKWPKDMVQHALNTANAIHSARLKPSPTATGQTEQKVSLRTREEVIKGTLDFAWVDVFGTLTIIDYKYGQGVPVFAIDEEGEPNAQLMLYAAAVAQANEFEFEKVRLAVIQPRVWAASEDPVSTAEVSIKRLRVFLDEIDEAIERAKKPKAPLVPGDHCQFCPAKVTCPEISTTALERAHIAFDIDEGIQAAPEPKSFGANQLTSILDACDRLEYWIKAVRTHAHELAESGEKIPGYKLVAKKPQTSWIQGAEAKAHKLFGNQAFKATVKLLTPNQLAKVFKDEAEEFIKENTVSISSGTNLVSEMDKRSPLESGRNSVFDI